MKRESAYPYKGNGPPSTTIHHLRRAMGRSQRNLAERFGTDHTTIRRYEINEKFTQAGLNKVAKSFGVKTEILFFPPEIAEIYRLPAKVQKEVLAIVESALRLYRHEH